MGRNLREQGRSKNQAMKKSDRFQFIEDFNHAAAIPAQVARIVAPDRAHIDAVGIDTNDNIRFETVEIILIRRLDAPRRRPEHRIALVGAQRGGDPVGAGQLALEGARGGAGFGVDLRHRLAAPLKRPARWPGRPRPNQPARRRRSWMWPSGQIEMLYFSLVFLRVT